MLTVPDGYREAMAAGNPIHIKMEFENGSVLTDADIDESSGVTLTDAFNPDTDVKMGKASCRQFQARIIINDNTRYIRWVSDFDLYFGVEDGEGDTIWVYFGKFTGQRPRNVTTLQAVDYTAYDQMRLFDACADDYLEDTTFNKRVDVLLTQIGTEVGINTVYAEALPDALDRNMSNRFTAQTYTFRQLLEYAAESCGCYARIGGANMDLCELCFFNTSDNIMQETNPRLVTRNEIFYEEHADLYAGYRWDDFDDLTWDEADAMTWNEVTKYYKDANAFEGVYFPKITDGVAGRYPSNVKTGHIYSVAGNPIPRLGNKTTHVTNYVKPIYDRLQTLGGSLPMKVECLGDLVTQAGDVIQVELEEGIIEMPIFVKTLHWNGMLVDTYETTAPDA